MLAHAPRLPFSLHALVAEAKRRARRRRVLLAVVVIVLAGGVGGAGYAAHPFGWLESGPTPGDYQPASLVYPVSVVEGVNAPPVTVSAASGGAAFVVGSDVAWRWNGRAWQSIPLPHISTANLQSVTSTGPGDAWAVGSRGLNGWAHNAALIAHWNGAQWNTELPGLTDASLSSVSATGPHDVWAAGTISTAKGDRGFWGKAQPLLLHWDGVAWRRQSLPWASLGSWLTQVVATGPSSVWVVRDARAHRPVLEYWNGGRWRAVPAPFGPHDPPYGFSATAGNDAWAVGGYGTGENWGRRSHPLAAHWNGSSWRFTQIPSFAEGDNVLLRGVAAARPDDAWAIGEIQPVRPNEAIAPKVFMLHWDGSSWRVAPPSVPSSFSGSRSIGAAADGTAWAITNCGDDNLVLGWNGTRWKAVRHPPDRRWQVERPGRLGPMPKSCASVGR